MSSSSDSTAAIKAFFVLGGPGSGKGTNCGNLVRDFGYTHFSAGDLLREAARSGTSDVAQQIAAIIKRGDIVPSEITVALIRQAIADHPNPRGYLLDGFPRKKDQARMFEEGVARALTVLYFDCSEATMEARVLGRAAGSAARDDDNAETIRRRFRVNVEECAPVVNEYKKEGRCHVIDANQVRDAVYAEVKKIFMDLGEKPISE